MNGWPYFLIWIPIAGIVGYLYRQGLAVSKRITAVLFTFLPGRFKDQATLNSCTGWVQHAGRFRESRTYEFTLDSRLSKGDVTVSLLDQKKQPLLRLTQQSPAGTAALTGKTRYYLRWEFKNATGTCALHW